MKKIITYILSILFVLAISLNSFAANKTYSVHNDALTIDIPSEYYVITQEDYKGSPLFTEQGLDEEIVLQTMKDQGVYLNAVAKDGMSDLIITFSDVESVQDFNDLNVIAQEDLLDYYSDLIKEQANAGNKYFASKIYSNDAATYIKAELDLTVNNVPCDRVMYYTVRNETSITVIFTKYNGRPEPTEKADYTKIVDSIVFKDNAIKPKQNQTEKASNSVSSKPNTPAGVQNKSTSNPLYKGLIGALTALILGVPALIKSLISGKKKRETAGLNEQLQSIDKQIWDDDQKDTYDTIKAAFVDNVLNNMGGEGKALSPLEKRDIIFQNQKTGQDDYGISTANPVCTSSILKSDEYLNRLRTPDNKKIQWIREGHVEVDLYGLEGVIEDQYRLYADGEEWGKIYICPYAQNSTYPPKGLVLAAMSDPLNTEGDLVELARKYGVDTDTILTMSKKEAQLKTAQKVQAQETSPKEMPQENKSGLTCPNCGAVLPADSLFCNKCGKEISHLGEADKYLGNELFKEVTHDTVIYMVTSKMIQEPKMNFFKDDRGLLNGLYYQHTTNPNILALKNLPNRDTHAIMCGMHALGAGIYVTLLQGGMGKPIEQFNEDDLRGIADSFARTDAYELALNTLGIPLDSDNKKVLDGVYMTGLETAKHISGSDVLDGENLRVYMQVMFNAGISLVMDKASQNGM